jgi:hypothetical protein
MNIYIVDKDPTKIGAMLPDSILRSAIIRGTQILINVAVKFGYDTNWKPGFKQHPTTKWLAINQDNWDWVVHYMIGLCEEFEYRFEKKHGCEKTVREIAELLKDHLGDYTLCNSFMRCMPNYLKRDNNISDVEAYRIFIKGKNNRKFTKREMPDWLV